MPDHWFFLLLVGWTAGVMSGMFGIGGGVIIVPALTMFLSYSITEASSTSLAALLLPVGVFAVIAYYRAGHLDVPTAALIAFGLLIMTWFGAEVALNLPADTLRQLYGVFLLYMAWRFIEPQHYYIEREARLRGPAQETQPAAADSSAENTGAHAGDLPWYAAFVTGLAAGILSGMFGIGGGVVIVPVLVSLFKFDYKRATGTSLGALLLPVGLPGVLRYASEDVLHFGAAAMVAVGLLFGAILGARIALSLPSASVKRLYGLFLVFVALRFIFGG